MLALNSSTYDITHKKSTTPSKKFFSLQTPRLAESFELFNSSLTLTEPEILPHKATCNPVVLA